MLISQSHINRYNLFSFILVAFNVGKAAIAGGAAFGLGALCFYGLGLANEPGAIDNAR